MESSLVLAFSLLQNGARNVQIASFVLLGIGALLAAMVVQRIFRRVYAAARGLSIRDRDRLGILRTPRDAVISVVFLVLGGLTLWFAATLRGVEAFTKETQIGVLKYEGRDANGDLKLLYVPTDPEGNEFADQAVRTTSPGDSIRLSYTLVMVDDNWLTLGVEQMYKIDYISGWYQREETMNGPVAKPRFEPINGGRDEALERLARDEDRSFPYSLWVKQVRFGADHEPIYKDLKPGTTWKVILAHNTIRLARNLDEAIAEETEDTPPAP